MSGDLRQAMNSTYPGATPDVLLERIRVLEARLAQAEAENQATLGRIQSENDQRFRTAFRDEHGAPIVTVVPGPGARQVTVTGGALLKRVGGGQDTVPSGIVDVPFPDDGWTDAFLGVVGDTLPTSFTIRQNAVPASIVLRRLARPGETYAVPLTLAVDYTVNVPGRSITLLASVNLTAGDRIVWDGTATGTWAAMVCVGVLGLEGHPGFTDLPSETIRSLGLVPADCAAVARVDGLSSGGGPITADQIDIGDRDTLGLPPPPRGSYFALRHLAEAVRRDANGSTRPMRTIIGEVAGTFRLDGSGALRPRIEDHQLDRFQYEGLMRRDGSGAIRPRNLP